MGVISKISLRNMSRRKSRYVLTTFTLIIGVALFGGVMIVSDSFQTTMLSSIDGQLGTADILFRSNTTNSEPNLSNGWFNPEEFNTSLHEVENIESVAFRISGFEIPISGVVGGNQLENSTNCEIYGLDILNPVEPELGGTLYILESIPEMENATSLEELLTYEDPTTNKRVMLITESLQIKLAKDAGDVVRVKPFDTNDITYDDSDTSTWEEFTIVAVIRDSGEAQDIDLKSGEVKSLSQGINPVFFVNLEKWLTC